MTLQLPAVPTTNQDAAKEHGKRGLGDIISCLVSSLSATYLMNYASLHGVDFKVLAIPSEVVKSTLEAGLITGIVWLTPQHIIAAMRDGIIWVRLSWRVLYKAATDPLT